MMTKLRSYVTIGLLAAALALTALVPARAAVADRRDEGVVDRYRWRITDSCRPMTWWRQHCPGYSDNLRAVACFARNQQERFQSSASF